MKKDKNKGKVNDFVKNWVIFFIWFILIIFILTKLGVCFIHEPGHYIIGKIYGCSEIKIDCPALFSNETFNFVDGWKNCPSPMVIGADGERICNLPTNIINIAGFILSILIVIPLFFIINNFCLKIKLKKFNLEGKFLILILITILIWALKSSAVDIFKIVECSISNEFAIKILNFLYILPDIYLYVILIIFILDVYILLIKMKIIFNKKLGRNQK